jgi:uncharacterized protein YjbI with pentapeptide repeats
MLDDSKQVNLRGRSFRGQNLSGKDFSYSDIRGADFTNAILKGVNFSYSKAGPRRIWLVCIAIAGLIGSAVASLISGYAGGLIGLLMFGDTELGPLLSRVASAFFFIALAILFFLVVRQGFGKNLGYFAIGIVVVLAIAVAGGTGEVGVAALMSTFALAASAAAMIVWSLTLTTVYLASGRVVATAISVIALVCAMPGALEATAPTNPELQTPFGLSRILMLCIAGIRITIVLASSIYVSWQVVAGNRIFSILGLAANAWIGTRGTSFRGADLTDADFTGADLKGADFRTANLTRTCWFRVAKLEQARTKGTYLDDLRIRQLLVAKNVQENEFVGRDLRGINLRDASLQRANFTGSDLSEATLENADLSGAKLAKSRLYGANLTGACLTGAVIQDWAISTDTIFENVQCEFIYMRLPTEDDPDPWRKPDNRSEVFQEGDFSDFIAPIIRTLGLYQQQHVDPRQIAGAFKTLDLFHYQGIDPSAAAISLKQLAEEHPEAKLEVIALEGRGNEKFRLQAAVAEEVDRSQLSARYLEKYRENSSLPYGELQVLLGTLAEKDRRILNLEEMVMTAIQSEKFYVEAHYNLGEVTYGDKITVGSITESEGVAIGRGARSSVSMGVSTDQIENLFRPLQDAARNSPLEKRNEPLQTLQEIKAEMAKGQQADDSRIAELIDEFVDLVPAAESTLLSTFAMPVLHKLTGPMTKDVLEKIQRNQESSR